MTAEPPPPSDYTISTANLPRPSLCLLSPVSLRSGQEPPRSNQTFTHLPSDLSCPSRSKSPPSTVTRDPVLQNCAPTSPPDLILPSDLRRLGSLTHPVLHLSGLYPLSKPPGGWVPPSPRTSNPDFCAASGINQSRRLLSLIRGFQLQDPSLFRDHLLSPLPD